MRRSRHRRDVIAIGEAYRWQIAALEEEARRLRAELDRVYGLRATVSVQVGFADFHFRMTREGAHAALENGTLVGYIIDRLPQAIGEAIVPWVKRDYRNDLRAVANGEPELKFLP